jgi:uncharacterized protein (TIGR03067 family)
MRRRIVWLVAVPLLVAPSLGSDAPKDYDGATQADELEGTWRLVAVEYDGGRGIPAVVTITYRGRNFTEVDGTTGTFTTDVRRKPAHLDSTATTGYWAGRTVKGIYQRDCDTLRIAFHLWGDERPTNFDEKRDLLVQTWKRMK